MIDDKLKDGHLMVCVAFIENTVPVLLVVLYKVVFSVSLPREIIGLIKSETLGNFLFCMFAKEVIYSTFVHSYSILTLYPLSILLTIICFAGQSLIGVVGS